MEIIIGWCYFFFFGEFGFERYRMEVRVDEKNRFGMGEEMFCWIIFRKYVGNIINIFLKY